MNKFEPNADLLRCIMSGKACLWIGAGASAEMGYPDWKHQVELMRSAFDSKGLGYDKESFEQHYSKGEYDIAFDVLSLATGVSRVEFNRILDSCNKSNLNGSDSIYNMVTKWPFGCYVTTNFDDEIQRHLEQNGRLDFSYFNNAKEDLALLGKDAHNAVFKLHGSLDGRGEPVVTRGDYAIFRSGDEKKYYRAALSRLFAEREVVVIGYSLNDVDVQCALEAMQLNIRPGRPFYLILANVSDGDIELYRRRYNAVVISYENPKGGTHQELNRILATYNQFIGAKPADCDLSSDAEKTIPLYMLRRLNKGGRHFDADNYALMNLPDSSSAPVSLEVLARRKILSESDWRETLNRLGENDLVSCEGDLWRRTPTGDSHISDAVDLFQGSRVSAFQQFVKMFGASLTSAQELLYVELAKACIEQIFKDRGILIASSLFSDRDVGGDELFAIFSRVAAFTGRIESVEHKLLFFQAMRRFLVQPTTNQKFYLSSLAQGYFMYHLMGMDPRCMTTMKEMLHRDCWFVDSNILQPLYAVGCRDFVFINGLFGALKNAGVQLYTTYRMLEEVREHLVWAQNHQPDYRDFRSVAETPRDSYGYNFFRDGFVTSMITKDVSSFSEYEAKITAVGGDDLMVTLNRYGVRLINIDPKNKSLNQKFEVACSEIEGIRKRINRFRDNDLQVPAEAELHVLMGEMEDEIRRINGNRKIYFLSTSTIFSQTSRKFRRWSATGLFRYVQLLPGNSEAIDSLSNCLQSEMYSIGFRVIDEANFTSYFKGEINLAKLQYEEEKRMLSSQILNDADTVVRELDNDFEHTPDCDKPLFVTHLASMINSRSAADAEFNKKIAEQAMTERDSLRDQCDKLTRKLAEANGGRVSKFYRNCIPKKIAALNRMRKARKARGKKRSDRKSRRK